MQLANRLQPLQANVFADMDRAKARALAAGREVIDLSLGSSDLPAPSPVLEAIAHVRPTLLEDGELFAVSEGALNKDKLRILLTTRLPHL